MWFVLNDQIACIDAMAWFQSKTLMPYSFLHVRALDTGADAERLNAIGTKRCSRSHGLMRLPLRTGAIRLGPWPTLVL